MSGQLDGKVAIITGGASGIGLASVEVFIEHGARVVLGDIQDDAGSALEKRFKGSLVYVHTDVTSEQAIKAVVASAAERYGRLDIMFNNAGSGGDRAAFIDLSAEGLDRTLALLTRSVHAGHKYAALQFKSQKTGGSIITTASAASFEGGWSSAAYTVAKHAVIGIVRAAVAELSPLGIRSNAICPGVIMTPIMAAALGVPIERSDEFITFLSKRFATFHPIGRIGWPRDIANAAVFLASDASEFITGAAIPVDGGASAVTMGNFGADAVAATQEFSAAAR